MNKSIIYSISSQPGRFGSTLYNHLFELYSLPYIYKSVAISKVITFKKILDIFETTELFYGLSISMPYKEVAYKYLMSIDKVKTSQENILAFNSLKKTNDGIEGVLTDYFIFKEFKKILNKSIKNIIIYGRGAMAKLGYDFFNRNHYNCSFLENSNLAEGLQLCSETKNFAFINASPVDLREVLSINTIQYPLLDLPVRLDVKSSNSFYYSGLWATKIQFQHQLKFYFDIDISIEELNSICIDLF